VLLDGPVDTLLSERVGEELLATLREALSNVARHAHAQHVDVEVTVTRVHVTLRVVDDGRGLPEGDIPHGNGLRNMATRAKRLGGSLALTSDLSGTTLEWHAPVG
jgi:signal transduction histidine kinase